MKVSLEEIEAKMSVNGGFTRKTLEGWGVPWPPRKGWKQILINGENEMKICPQCQSVYLGSKTECDDCKIELMETEKFDQLREDARQNENDMRERFALEYSKIMLTSLLRPHEQDPGLDFVSSIKKIADYSVTMADAMVSRLSIREGKE